MTKIVTMFPASRLQLAHFYLSLLGTIEIDDEANESIISKHRTISEQLDAIYQCISV